jgi:hypothetical protein
VNPPGQTLTKKDNPSGFAGGNEKPMKGSAGIPRRNGWGGKEPRPR